jgi:hypothetical protein
MEPAAPDCAPAPKSGLPDFGRIEIDNSRFRSAGASSGLRESAASAVPIRARSICLPPRKTILWRRFQADPPQFQSRAFNPHRNEDTA